ncbi:E3 ubiquitin-protein ligase rnf168-like [Clytia hemisphaerica]
MSKTKKYKKAKSKANKDKEDTSIQEITINDQSFTDFLCPICLEILIEPVQMPCKHELCTQCFKSHVEDTSLSCPMCRQRISIWVRRNAKNNTLVNQERWALIQSMFPERVQRRLDGLDDIEDQDNFVPHHNIAEEGEVRKEFEDQMKKIEEERAVIDAADLEYIRKLTEEDNKERQRQEELDMKAAHELQKQEMANLGVTLKSPSEHQRSLLALLKPKSPMKLRRRSIPNKQGSSSSSKSKATRNILTSPNHTITSFFQKLEHKNEPNNTQQNINDIKNSSKTNSRNCNGTNSGNPNDSLNGSLRIERNLVSTSSDKQGVNSTSMDNISSYSSSTVTRPTPIQIDLDESITEDSDRELAERLQREYDQQWQNNNIVITPQKTPLRATDNLIRIDTESKSSKIDRLKSIRKRNDDLSISLHDVVPSKARKTR